jgi:hypothetical protein
MRYTLKQHIKALKVIQKADSWKDSCPASTAIPEEENPFPFMLQPIEGYKCRMCKKFAGVNPDEECCPCYQSKQAVANTIKKLDRIKEE